MEPAPTLISFFFCHKLKRLRINIIYYILHYTWIYKITKIKWSNENYFSNHQNQLITHAPKLQYAVLHYSRFWDALRGKHNPIDWKKCGSSAKWIGEVAVCFIPIWIHFASTLGAKPERRQSEGMVCEWWVCSVGRLSI